jgi:predicted nucleic acid-binding protein
MPEKKQIVINTGPILALIAGIGSLDALKGLYSEVIVPFEVCYEILSGSSHEFGKKEFQEATWLKKIDKPVTLSSYLSGVLDRGEAAVIQYTIDKKIKTVCIDETAGRRVARLSGLKVTGSIGILLKAKECGRKISVSIAIERMRERGIWMSKKVEEFARDKAGE